LVDIFQPCVTFNKINTYQWFRDNTYYIDDSHDASDRNKAFQKAVETEKLPLGIFYINYQKTPFEENIDTYKDDKRPLYQRDLSIEKLCGLIK
jgi:2-oxoglutarate ferredoxin oxidoreductase subunit beta